ncbi:RNase adapter RapZ [Moraxella sp.]|uniref:RNase adapter RapZ n=1 Tax=Moraxella sp. TaxID=479 RepID=UPI0026DBD10E|nr:RNase adapter RapZ [Moraxella sp.]MDO4895094.1 RNase adapter RapZ [Moraxella sp.]
MTKQASIIIVSGRSGSGKTSVLNILEDFGFYVIDNLPLSIVTETIKKLTSNDSIHKIALGVDVRAPAADLSNFPKVHDGLIACYGESAITVLYTTAAESVLVARFGATRRVHPLMATGVTGNLPKAILSEIELLEPIASLSDIKIDTSNLNTHELKEKVRDYLGVQNQVTINLLSFGFKYGAPIDADFIFDVRVLPNPHWHIELRQQSGEDAPVQAFFAQYPEVDEMAVDIATYLNKWLPSFLQNNRHTITIGIGCTGGQHRSVYMTRLIEKRLAQSLPNQMRVVAKHREKRYWCC